jgi:hypothetical protein
MIEYQQVPQLPGLTMLHGYVGAFTNVVMGGEPAWSGCVYFLFVENSEVTSPTS